MVNPSSKSPLQSLVRFVQEFWWRFLITILILTSIIIIAINPTQFQPPRLVQRRIYYRFIEAAPAA
ncbi:hypothetical protein PRIPAC_80298 [Pristionchus pacificus]|uniref:Uncharacterized protein n=1 Tax=Pristionchus pacificus TaxID=54126 RepID=A0A2A6CNV0_PRIPA|nr:hypothetical protein PRIPAC_80298 [Pristionchus pacificus]|eukprot:PDM79733.1 hypothetical protein PRIPAC_32312 [Pristionchus pacificus]